MTQISKLCTTSSRSVELGFAAMARNQRWQGAILGAAVMMAFQSIRGWFEGPPNMGLTFNQLHELRDVFPSLDTSNISQVVKNVLELSNDVAQYKQIHKVTMQHAENILKSPHIDQDVRTSMTIAGLYQLPLLNGTHPVGTALTLTNLLAEVRNCHINKVIEVKNCHEHKIVASTQVQSCERRQTSQEQELSSYQAGKEQLYREMEALRAEKDDEIQTLQQEISALTVKEATCEVDKKNYIDKFEKCENRGFVKRMFCWVT